MMKHH